MKKIAKTILGAATKAAIARNHYRIIAITGSVGKTSTKKAVSLVLQEKYKVLSFVEEGYNTEFGLPLILLERKIPRSKLGWFILMLLLPLEALKKRNYDYAVLEMGADRPGDIKYLTNLVKPDIAIITNVSGVHLEKFGTVNNVAKEKAKILSALAEGGAAIINTDNEFTAKMAVPQGVRKITFGRKSNEIKIIGQSFDSHSSLNRFKVYDKVLEIKSNAVGEHLLYSFAAAIAVGVSEKIDSNLIVSALGKYLPVRGRINIIEGASGSVILDDSYNASPASMKNALDVLEKFPGKRKIAVLGAMGELGGQAKEAHQKIGSYLVGKCDILVTVGDISKKYLAKSAIDAGLAEENVYSFNGSAIAGKYVKEILQSGDIVLFKGSQNASRMEKAVKIVMKSPESAFRRLPRQGKEWERR